MSSPGVDREGKTDPSAETRAEAWVQALGADAENRDNEFQAKTAKIYQFLLDHRRAYERGQIDHTDLPSFNEEVCWGIEKAVGFGTIIAARNARLFVATGPRDRFLGCYGDEENARDRAADHPEHQYEATEPITKDPDSVLDPLLEAPGGAPTKLGQNLQHIIRNEQAFLEGDVDPRLLPQLSVAMRELIHFSVKFGLLWEYSYPGLFAVFENEQFVELHHGRRRAQERADDLGPDHHAQRVPVIDGVAPIEEFVTISDTSGLEVSDA